MFRRLLALFQLCAHRQMIRLHVDGVWYFVCDCGHREPMLTPRKRGT